VQKSIGCLLLVLSICCASVVTRAAEPTLKPIQASELLALVAGNALPANVVHEIDTRGLNFHPDDAYRTLLKKAGADATTLAAMDKARVAEGAEDKPEIDLLQHLSTAKVLMADKHYSEAAKELSAALELSFARPETGFVMGELLRRQEEWPQAAAIYSAVLREAPDFPEIHTKLSYILYRLEDDVRALDEAKAGLAQNPDDAEAHKNAGLALMSAKKREAAEAEYREALHLKPDYAAVYYDLGILYQDRKAYDQAIVEYKKAIALDPSQGDPHCNLGNTYRAKGDLNSAIREFREAKRLSPDSPINLYNLAAALTARNPREAIPVFQELEDKFPDFEMCHDCFGKTLLWTGDVAGAQSEFQKAVQLDPSDPEPHLSLGEIQKNQKNYDAALEEFRTAERLDESSSKAHKDIGEILLTQKDLPGAIAELKQAESLAPTDWAIHDLYAQALDASGNTDLAIAEFKEAVLLNPKQFKVMLELGTVLERKGDWVGAMAQYHRASLGEATANTGHRPGEAFYFNTQAQKAYKTAQLRLDQHLAELRAAGKSDQASDLEKQIQAGNAAEGNTEKMESLLQDGATAFEQRRFDDAEKLYQEVVELAQKIPDDKQTAFALDRLANTYGMKGNFPKATGTLHRELDFVQKAYGPGSLQAIQPLMSLGRIAAGLKDYVAAEQYFSRALAIDEAALGENSGETVQSLRAMAGLYMVQRMWAKAEPFLLRAVKAQEADAGPDDSSVMNPLWGLCDLYDEWQKPEQAEPCYKRTVDLVEKNYGKTSAYLIPSLNKEAAALRKLGHPDEAEKLEQRSASIKKVTAKQY
jgi:tetratricopeptide (TPR) repeat protein